MRREKDKRFNSDGDELIYIGNDLWVPIKILKSKEEAETFYHRYDRPNIYLFSVLKNVILPIVCLIAFDLLLKYVFCPTMHIQTIIYISLSLVGLYVFMRLGDIAIFCVRLYQRFASLDIRTKCSMTPTCSNYCIAAIQKYGLFIGLLKTWHRLRHKCNGDEITDQP